MTHPSEIETEADRILELVGGSAVEAFHLVERQMNVLVLRTQVMLSLSGIVVTVTGFSGKAIAQTSPLARVSISAGILFVLVAAAMAIGGVLRLRWLTQTLGRDTREMLVRGLRVRDEKSRWLAASLVAFVIGFSLYCLAIAQLLIAA